MLGIKRRTAKYYAEVGNKYNRLTILDTLDVNGIAAYKCLCDCGVIKNIGASQVKYGHSKSCGCYQKEVVSARHKVHGYSDTREGNIYLGMIQRCYDPKVKSYHRYGGRGITVCDRWRESVINFVADMGNAPDSKHSLDRINNDGNYEPSNCRWATMKEQHRNKRNNRFLTHAGETLVIQDWAIRIGIDHTTLVNRLQRGWTVEKSVTTPKLRHKKTTTNG